MGIENTLNSVFVNKIEDFQMYGKKKSRFSKHWHHNGSHSQRWQTHKFLTSRLEHVLGHFHSATPKIHQRHTPMKDTLIFTF